MILQVNNGVKVIAKIVGTYPLRLSSRFKLDMKDYYFISIASQILIFMSVLAQDGFDFNFNKDFYSIHLQNKLVVCGLLIDSLYHLYVDANINLNKQVVSTVGQKRSRDKIK